MKAQDSQELSVLKEILKWTRFAGMKEVKSIVATTLDDDQKRLAYQLSDGSKGSQQICDATGIKSKATVTKYWKAWIRLGLGDTVAVSGGDRFKRAFDLEDFGYEIQQPAGPQNHAPPEKPAEQSTDQGILTTSSDESGGK